MHVYMTCYVFTQYDHAVGIYGGYMLGVRSVSGLAFYDWDSTDLVRRIEIAPKHVSSYLYMLNYFIIQYAQG